MGALELAREAADAMAARHLGGRGNVGLAIGLLVGDERLELGYGETARGSGLVPDARTVFEIGSITKVFTAIALVEAAGRGEVRLDQPVGELLPQGVRTPSYRGEPITLAQLAQHASSLPRLPANLWATVKDKADPYRDYRTEDLHAYLDGATIGFPPGSGVLYSNLGAGLLGHALSLRAGEPYEAMIAGRVLRPLGLVDTAIELSPDQEARAAQGHDAAGAPTSRWTFRSLAGAGAFLSTVDDMLIFLRANLDPDASPLAGPLRECHSPRPVAWRRRIGVGSPHALVLTTASLLVQRLAPVLPGSWTFVGLVFLPTLAALVWKGFWSGAWAALATWAGGLAFWGERFASQPAVWLLLSLLIAAGGLGGYLPPPWRARLGWQELTLAAGATALWHNGGTGGFRSFIGFAPGARAAVAVLSNSANGVDAIGVDLLRELCKADVSPPSTRAEIEPKPPL